MGKNANSVMLNENVEAQGIYVWRRSIYSLFRMIAVNELCADKPRELCPSPKSVFVVQCLPRCWSSHWSCLGWPPSVPLESIFIPKVDFPTVTVTTRLEGASPEEIESQITKRIEEAINTISGLDELRSTTIEGQSQIFASFVLEKDIETAANEVREKVSTVLRDFPPGTDPPVIERFDPDASPIMAIVVSGARVPREVTEIADKKIKRQLETIKDIGAVSLVGDRKREVQIYIDPDRLTAYNLSIQTVKDAIRKQNAEIPGGRLTWETREEGLRTLGRIEEASAFNEIIVADVKGAPVRVKDIGYAVDGEEEARTLSRLDGENAVSLLIRKQSGTNTVEVVDRITARLDEIRKTLPQDIRFQIVRDQSRFIRRSMEEVQEHLILGGFLAALVVAVFHS